MFQQRMLEAKISTLEPDFIEHVKSICRYAVAKDAVKPNHTEYTREACVDKTVDVVARGLK